MPAPPLPVVINRSGGTAARLGADLEPKVREVFRAAGIPIELVLCDGANVADRVRERDATMVAVGGGDGTLAAAAGVLAGTGRTLAMLPLGTRNHLAGTLGMGPELETAVRAIAAGHTQAIDLAQAGERIFVNNASLGVYAHLVREREAQGLPKLVATVPAALRVLCRWRTRHLALRIDGSRLAVNTPLLFVGNNRYAFTGPNPAEREHLDDGVLSVASVGKVGPLGLAAMALRIVVGRGDPDAHMDLLCDAREVVVEGAGWRDIACDGEVEPMALPLTFRILPGALRVVVPAPLAEGNRGA